MHFCGKRKITLKIQLKFSVSLSSNAACSFSMHMVVLFLDGFILLMYKSLGKKEIVNKTNRVYVPLSMTSKFTGW